jgi:hypothetical protein
MIVQNILLSDLRRYALFCPRNRFKEKKCKSKFIMSSENGGDIRYCGICDNGWYDSCILLDTITYKYYKDEDGCSDSVECIEYCDKCNILMNYSHIHANNGCSDSLYYSTFISKYSYEGIVFEGMPIFRSLESAKTLLLNESLKILEMKCSCNGGYCIHASYPENKSECLM